MTGRFKKIAAVAILSAAALVSNARAAYITLTQPTPHHYSDAWEVSGYVRNHTADVLNEATMDYSDLLGQIANLPHNVSAYSDDGDDSNNLHDFIVGAKNDRLLGAGIGNLDNQDLGWDATIGTDGIIDVTNNGIIPGVTYARWTDGLAKEIDLGIADTLLNGYTLELDTNRVIPEMATAQRTYLNVYPADGFAVNVVPEPATSVLMVGGLAGIVAGAARKRK